MGMGETTLVLQLFFTAPSIQWVVVKAKMAGLEQEISQINVPVSVEIAFSPRRIYLVVVA